jgi:hypothetical protein
MRVLRILALGMDARKPRNPPACQIASKVLDKLHTLFGGKLTRQGQSDLVGHAGILSIGQLATVQPGPRLVGIDRHMLSGEFGLGVWAGNIEDMRACRTGGVCGASDALEVQRIDRHAPHPPSSSCPPKRGSGYARHPA